VIARVWGARIDSRRAAEYDRFALERSLPTFRAHRGFRGCAFLGEGDDRLVLTLWDSLDDVSALEGSAQYRETVDAIMGAGFILDVTPAVTADLHGADPASSGGSWPAPPGDRAG
jgi:heme-degrading monooxygenase HmoA